MTPTQQKSMAAAVVLVVGVVLSFASGKAFIPSEVLTDQVLSANHLANQQAVAALAPGDQVASVGLRHTVSTKLEEAQVIEIVDGDTLWVDVGDTAYTVRLTGINTPEAANDDPKKNTPEGERSAKHLASIVRVGDIVYLQKDTSNVDKDGNLLRFVWSAKPNSFTDVNEIKAKMINGRMLTDGYAMAHKFKPDDAYFNIFRALQLDAYHSERGLWAEGADWSYSV
ncbi:MAG: thermonuclease family protein [Slackia faecicanis]|nr:thermonuclease family protein [Slackia faecicanis]